MSLRTEVLRGATYLTARHALGVPIALASMLLLTRVIGPSAYGLFAAAFGIFVPLERVCLSGIGVYLVRRAGQLRPEVEDQAFSLLLLLGVAGTAIALVSLPLLAHWVRLSGFAPVCAAVLLGLPLGLLGQVPLARLERRLDFRDLARIELGCQLAALIVALPLALGGFGVWAPVAGWWGRQTLNVALLYAREPYRPRLVWHPTLVKEILGHGLGFLASQSALQLRSLAHPLIVARYAGAESVAYVAVALRVVEALGFFKGVSWRLSVAVLARIQDDRRRMVRAVGEGMRLQLLVLGPLLVAFAWAGPLVLPAVFGATWRPVLDVYPFIALGYLTNAVFNLESSALYAVGRNGDVLRFNLACSVLLVGTAFLAVPRLGLIGYGLAEAATLASYGVLHLLFVRRFGSPDYGLAALWWAGFGLALFSAALGWWSLAGLVTAAAAPATWRELAGLAQEFRPKRVEAAVGR